MIFLSLTFSFLFASLVLSKLSTMYQTAIKALLSPLTASSRLWGKFTEWTDEEIPPRRQEEDPIQQAAGQFPVIQAPAIMLFPPDRTMLFWLACPLLLATERFFEMVCSFLVYRVTVVPLTNITPLSLHYQNYLMTVFHRSYLAFCTHFVVMPMVIATLFKHASFFLVSEQLLYGGLGLWWFAFGLISRRKVWGFANVLATLLLFECRDYLAMHSLSTVLLLGLIIGFSHGGETNVPPRSTIESARWISPSRLCRLHGVLVVIRDIGFSLTCGIFLEIIASFRVFPIFVLKLLMQLGYRDTVTDKLHRVSAICEKTGIAALDFVGLSVCELLSREQFNNMLDEHKTAERRVKRFDLFVQCHHRHLSQTITQEEIEFLRSCLANPEIWPQDGEQLVSETPEQQATRVSIRALVNL